MMFARDKSQMCSMPMSMHGAESMEGKLSPCASVINISISRYATHR